MRTTPPSFPLRRSVAQPWRPMTDAEWAALTAILHRPGPGRPPRDARRLWDGIFWIACSKEPWRALPATFGRPDTAHRALRRAGLVRQLHRMLLRVSDHPAFADDPLRGIEWFVVRAFRRAFRVAHGAIAYARHLGLASALPAEPYWLPQPHLSEAVKRMADLLRAMPPGRPMVLLRAVYYLFRRSGGEPRFWKTTG